ncbi:conserved hypothetical protein [Paecilomyces variotii No. 5]|uniref:Uncharacterized protein n=1 Tax=Byssochlamys spectabilis (strain No. 5 / NBRC 109023) TaxID=1356009 RepID=V5FZT9_BYSSN|nr:conserved hypothetical protein [Paecilomyces variotii No. 5]
MSTPDRKFDRFSSRRNNHSPYESPFRRARLNNYSEPDIDVSRIPSPSPKYGASPRRSFGQTRTLRGAYEATSRTGTTMTDDFARPAPPLRSAGGTPSPRVRRQRDVPESMRSPVSNVSSPPGELLDAYRQINDADNLVDLVEQDEYDFQQEQLRTDRRGPSPRHTMRETHSRASDHMDENLSFLDELTDDSLRAKLANHIRDEQRLKRVTAKESPVFSRAKVGIKAALSADSLQRREAQQLEETDDGMDPSLNLPRSWGSARRNRRDWMSTLKRRNVDAPVEEPSRDEPVVPGWEPEMDFTARSLQVSDSPPMRRPAETRMEPERVTERRSPRLTSEGTPKSISPEKRRSSQNGSPIPDSPVVIYKDSSNKPSMAKSDSQELLRKLARAESPPQNTPQTSTPDSKPVDKWMLAKTPVVTGAWVDTPMTERVTKPPEDTTDQIISPSKPERPGSKSEETPQRPKKQEQEKQQTTRNQEVEQKETRKQDQIQKQSEKKPVQREREEAKKPEEKKVKRKLELIKPRLPKSGLESVLEDAKSEGHSLVLGDDTINSLQDMLDQDSSFIKTEDDSSMEKQADSMTPEIGEDENAPFTAILERMDSRVGMLSKSLNETAQDLDGVLKGMEALMLKHNINLSRVQAVCQQQESKITGETRLGHFFRPDSPPRLWRRDAISNRIRTTRLGWLVFALLIWYWSESVMCSYYSHPFIAEKCDRNCLSPDAPRFPFVLPTMLWRWSHLSTVLTPVLTIFVAFLRLIAQLFGFWDGYSDDSPSSVQPWGLNRFGFGRDQGPPLRHIPVIIKTVPDGPRTQTMGAATGLQNPVQVNTNRNPVQHWDSDGLSMDNDEDL